MQTLGEVAVSSNVKFSTKKSQGISRQEYMIHSKENNKMTNCYFQVTVLHVLKKKLSENMDKE